MHGEWEREMPLGEMTEPSGDQQIGVSLLRGDDGSVAVKLVQRTFAPGLGWFDQKTLVLNPGQLGPLADLLGQAERVADTLPAPPRSRVLRFRSGPAQRPAAGRAPVDEGGAKLLQFRIRAS
ncbi:MAG: hypothetical protein HY331_15760 [Chloroflexi bacterium]|nr:hypothetical protein [Chloroflexota bacterium]